MSLRKVRSDHRGFWSHQNVKQVWAWLIDLIFPPMCGGCGRVDFRWCGVCWDDLRAAPVMVKERPSQGMAGLCASGLYDGILKQAIQAFKYKDAVELAEPLAERLVTVLERRKWAFDIIIPVPLSAERLAERGYNQAYLLGHHVAKQMNIPCRSDDLRRIRNTDQQTRLKAWQRAENVKDAFAAVADLANQSVLLIDDVVTTASTLKACADALRNAGARAVYAIAVATSDNVIDLRSVIMDVKIHGDGIKISEDLDAYTRSKVDKLDRYLPNIAHIGVELAIMRTHRGANLAIAQITVQHARGAILRAEEKLDIENRDTIRFAINKAVDKLHRQIDRFKSKRKSKQQRVRDKYKATIAELDIAEEVPEYDAPDAEDFVPSADIFRRKQIELILMNEQEAIEQLELLDHNFYMFMNADTAQVNVLYRRENGGYGILVPQ